MNELNLKIDEINFKISKEKVQQAVIQWMTAGTIRFC